MPQTADRNTPRREGETFEGAPASGQTIHRGALVCLNGSNELVRGATATGLRCMGVAQTSTRDPHFAGRIRVRRGTYRFENSASGDAITLSDVGNNCFIVDDFTVAKTAGGDPATRSVCGKVRDVDAEGVWVEI